MELTAAFQEFWASSPVVAMVKAGGRSTQQGLADCLAWVTIRLPREVLRILRRAAAGLAALVLLLWALLASLLRALQLAAWTFWLQPRQVWRQPALVWQHLQWPSDAASWLGSIEWAQMRKYAPISMLMLICDWPRVSRRPRRRKGVPRANLQPAEGGETQLGPAANRESDPERAHQVRTGCLQLLALRQPARLPPAALPACSWAAPSACSCMRLCLATVHNGLHNC